MDRIAKFARELDRRHRDLETAESITDRLGNEHFTGLLEERVRQASRSLSDERCQYLASLIANGLSGESVEYSESRHLLRLLDEMSDVEVVWLRFYREPIMGDDKEFRERHENILAPVVAKLGSSQNERDNETLRRSYKEHLCQLGMSKHRYRVDIKSKTPKFDAHGMQEIQGYFLTSLGGLLLRQIGLGDP